MGNDTRDVCINALSYQTSEFLKDDPIIAGIVVILVLYVLIFVVGVLASWLTKRRQKKMETTSSLTEAEDLVLAGKSLGTVVGTMTMSATMVGGALLNGTAEILINPNQGLMWAQAPFCYVFALLFKGCIFVEPMFNGGYRTCLDPIQHRFGKVMALLEYFPPLMADVFWSAAILTALGSGLSVIVGMNYLWSVVISAGVVVIYTFVGGLYSVAYTDIIQMVLLGGGLWLAVPFALTNPATSSIVETAANSNSTWLGQPIEGVSIALFIDIALVLMCGDFCWQPSYQRLLAMKTVRDAKIVAVCGACLTIVLLIPTFLLGAAAFSTDWNATEYASVGPVPIPECNYPLALPMVLRYLLPLPVTVIGLGSLCAAVMSSADSAFLSSATLITLNIYTPFRMAVTKGKRVSDREQLIVMRIAIFIIGVTATCIALFVARVYGLLVLAGDCLYIFLLPELISALFIPFTNTYGALVSFWFGVVMRLLTGEPLIGLPTVIYWPYADGEAQMFPYRTTLVLCCLVIVCVVSLIARECAKRFECCRKIDAATFRCFVPPTEKSIDGEHYGDGIDRKVAMESENTIM